MDTVEKVGDVTLLDTSCNHQGDIFEYGLIGFASGIYYSKFHDVVVRFGSKNLPHGNKVFLIYAYGVKKKNYVGAIKK